MDNYRKNASTGGCGSAKGSLPSCAPLAAAYVPMQQEAEPRYDANMALTRGTLFPGLDLPFMDHVNKNNPYAGTPLGEIMALSFVFHELNLYLDTHPKDKEAFQYMKKIGNLLNEGKKAFAKRFGPLTPNQLTMSETFNWIDAPWPWAVEQRGV